MSDIDLMRQVKVLQAKTDSLIIPEKTIDTISPYLALPGLKGFWPLTSPGNSGQAEDMSPLAVHLTNNNNAPSQIITNFAGNVIYNGVNQYHNVADNAAHDIIGNETYIASDEKGLTIMMWISPLAAHGAVRRHFSKGTTTGNARAYYLSQTASDAFNFGVSSNGTAVFEVNTGSTFIVGNWYFIAGRYDPSTEIKLYVGSNTGLATFQNVTSIPATLNNSATGLAIGAQADGTQFTNIRASRCALCAMRLDDEIISRVFQSTRGEFLV